MVKESHIIVRVSEEDKKRIVAAARSVGKSITLFVLEVTMKAVDSIEERTKSDRPRIIGKGHCPTWFRASCWTASQGGSMSYRWVGKQMAGSLGAEEPYELEEVWEERVEELRELLRSDDDERVIEWFHENLPAFISLVPSRRHAIFISGLREFEEEEGIGL